MTQLRHSQPDSSRAQARHMLGSNLVTYRDKPDPRAMFLLHGHYGEGLASPAHSVDSGAWYSVCHRWLLAHVLATAGRIRFEFQHFCRGFQQLIGSNAPGFTN